MTGARWIGRGSLVRAVCALLAIGACANIAAGILLAVRDPRRASDLWTMVGWCRQWLLGGQSLYGAIDAATDYPPNAIVLLSPLALVPDRYIVPLWTIVAVVLTPVLPWLVVRVASGKRRSLEQAIPVLLYLCWAAPRTLLQFSVLSMTLAGVALLIVDRRPLAGGVAIGLALFKPHVAGPFALWMLVTGRIRPLLIGAGIVLLGAAVYDVRIGESPLTTVAGWSHVLATMYGGANALVGHMSIRAWIDEVVRNPMMADAIWVAVSLLLLLVLVALARRDSTRRLEDGGLAIPAMFCLWSLLAIYHNGNNMILMLPAFVWIWFDSTRRGSYAGWIAVFVLEATLAFDVPVRLHGAGSGVWSRMAIEQFDRMVVLATLVLVAASWRRPAAARPT